MHLGERLAALRERIGKHVVVRERVRLLWVIPFTRRLGWLSIEDEGDHWAVLWTAWRDTHNPLLHGDAFAIDVRKDTGERRRQALSGAYRTALTLHEVGDEEEASWVFRRVGHLIDLAYAYHIVRPWVVKPDIIPSVRG